MASLSAVGRHRMALPTMERAGRDINTLTPTPHSPRQLRRDGHPTQEPAGSWHGEERCHRSNAPLSFARDMVGLATESDHFAPGEGGSSTQVVCCACSGRKDSGKSTGTPDFPRPCTLWPSARNFSTGRRRTAPEDKPRHASGPKLHIFGRSRMARGVGKHAHLLNKLPTRSVLPGRLR